MVRTTLGETELGNVYYTNEIKAQKINSSVIRIIKHVKATQPNPVDKARTVLIKTSHCSIMYLKLQRPLCSAVPQHGCPLVRQTIHVREIMYPGSVSMTNLHMYMYTCLPRTV